MNVITKADVKGPVFGIFLMMIFTLVWGLIAENALNNRDYRILGIVFSVVILVFMFFYISALKFLKNLPEPTEKVDGAKEAKRKKQFLIIGSIEGIGIPVVKNILASLNLDKYFIPSFALIIGLHFFPLAKVFENKFHYYMGYWTTLIAVIGFVLTYKGNISIDLITAFVSIGCAISTTIIGTRFILIINSKRRLIN